MGLYKSREELRLLSTEELAAYAKEYIFVSREKANTDAPWPPRVKDDIAGYEQAVLDYYRVYGFPVYRMTPEEQYKELQKLIKFDHTTLVDKGNVRQTMHGLGLAWTYFDHMWGIPCGKMKTPLEVFNDDKMFLGAIKKRMRYGVYISHGGIRKALRSYTGTQCVSNFRPTAAACIYSCLLPEEGGVVFDPSAGWGGRLLGSLASPRVKKYIATDPSTHTIQGLRAMETELLPMAAKLGRELEVSLWNYGSEIPEIRRGLFGAGTLDLCFTSPPYWETEKYSTEITQSYIQFGTKEKWMDGFMRQTLLNCHYGLKPTGKLAINIAGVKGYPELADDFEKMAAECGFAPQPQMQLLLSKMMGTRELDENGQLRAKKNNNVRGVTDTYKAEPIFIFKKV